VTDEHGGRYILDADGNPVPEPDLLAWGAWLERHSRDRVVQQDRFDHPFPPTDDQIARHINPLFCRRENLADVAASLDLRILVSTVFLGLDHRFTADGPPVLWESMIFGGPHSGEQRRYTSKADALAGHADLCALVRQDIAASSLSSVREADRSTDIGDA